MKEQLKEMNKEIKHQKKVVYYGNDVHERFKEMRSRIERVKEVTEEKSMETENSISFEL